MNLENLNTFPLYIADKKKRMDLAKRSNSRKQ